MTEPCAVCGCLPAPALHDRCHDLPGIQAHGCGHLLVDHTAGMRCRVCGVECAGWQPPKRTEHEHEHEPRHEQEALF